jgi:methanogenic corrinoid protein MtbC1
MRELAKLVAELKEQEALLTIKRHLDVGVPPTELLRACERGMRKVGSRYEKGIYYISGLIMAGEIMRQSVDMLRPVMIKGAPSGTLGRVLLGTIQGDIHDIGKNLFRDLLECHGFTVLDLGVDIPAADFVAAESEFRPHLVAASALIAESIPHLRELVELFRDATRSGSGRRPCILIGGGQVNERVFWMSGADYWAEDAFSGVKICRKLVKAAQAV